MKRRKETADDDETAVDETADDETPTMKRQM
jgi:hypothetical protein